MLEAGEGGFDPASLTKKQESHLSLSEMRIEQRPFPLPSRGSSGRLCRKIENYGAASSTMKVSYTSEEGSTNAHFTLDLACIDPELIQKLLAHNDKKNNAKFDSFPEDMFPITNCFHIILNISHN